MMHIAYFSTTNFVLLLISLLCFVGSLESLVADKRYSLEEEICRNKGASEMAGPEQGKPRGRMSAYAFFISQAQKDFERDHPNEELNFLEFAQKSAQTWKKLSESEKAKFAEMAATELENTPEHVPAKHVEDKELEINPDWPKRHLSAYFYFCEDVRDKIKADLHGADVEQVAIECGRRWANMSSDAKATYEALSAKDKIRWEGEWAIYNQNAQAGEIGAKEVKSSDE